MTQARWRLRALVLSASLLPALALAGYALYETRASMTEIALLRRRPMAQLAAHGLKLELDALAAKVEAMADRRRVRIAIASGRWDEAAASLGPLLRQFPHAERLMLSDPEGRARAVHPNITGAVGRSFAHRGWYKGVSRDWRPYVSDVYLRESTPRRQVVAVASPVPGEDGRPIAILMVQFGLDRFTDWARSAGASFGGHVHVFDRSGVEALPGTGEEEPPRLAADAPERRALAGEAGITQSSQLEDGGPSVTAYEPVPAWGWAVSVEQPAAKAFAERDRAVRTLAGLLAAVIVLIGLLAAKVLAAARALDAANRELDSFAATASHDLSTPLRGIEGMARILDVEEGGRLSERGRADLAVIVSSAHNMGKLIADLLELARASQQPVRREEVDLAKLASEEAETLRRAFPERSVALEVEPGLSARGDARLLRAVVRNLLENAWKYTSGKAEPRVSVGRENGAFFVRDNGMGFDERETERLFEAFVRLPEAADHPGSGVGLSIVSRIVERHGGRVWARARPGEGATFFFSLP